MSGREHPGASDQPGGGRDRDWPTPGPAGDGVASRGGDASEDVEMSKGVEAVTPATNKQEVVDTAVTPSASSGPRVPWLLAPLRVLLWMPKHCRYDPDNPPKFTLALNLLFGFASCFTVANLYYNQPVLNKIAETFDVSYEEAASVATLLQAGYATGLLLLCPLGDIVKRRPFILGLTWVTALFWLGLCITNNFRVFMALSFICGVTTVTPQLMLPLVGDIAPPHRKASSLAIVVSGLMLGMLFARLLSGIVAHYTDWRNIYWLSFGLQHTLLIALFLFMPDYPSTNTDLGYPAVLLSIGRMLVTEPLLVQACVVGLCMGAAFTSFWTTLTFLLASPPYEMAPVTIGLFSLIGILVITGGPLYGRHVADRFVPWITSVAGQVIALSGAAVGTFVAQRSIAGVVIQAMAIDVGSQSAHVANRAAIYTIDPKARNRLNTAYMVMAFVGQLSGTAIGNRLYNEGGWKWSGACTMGFLVFSIVICFAKGPHEPGWFGWSGGWNMRAPAAPKTADPPSEGEGDQSSGGSDVEAALGSPEAEKRASRETTKEEVGKQLA